MNAEFIVPLRCRAFELWTLCWSVWVFFFWGERGAVVGFLYNAVTCPLQLLRNVARLILKPERSFYVFSVLVCREVYLNWNSVLKRQLWRWDCSLIKWCLLTKVFQQVMKFHTYLKRKGCDIVVVLLFYTDGFRWSPGRLHKEGWISLQLRTKMDGC